MSSIFGMSASGNGCGCTSGKTGEECILAHKIYDQCRMQVCLTPSILGSSKAAETKPLCGEIVQEGDMIVPPSNTASVSAEHLRLKRIFVLSKNPNPFRSGYWDIEVQFLFVYKLVFRTSDNMVIDRIWAQSTYKTKVTLFGSMGTDIVFSTDMFNFGSDCADSDPFVCVEGKAVALSAELKYAAANNCCNNCCGCGGCCNNCGNCCSDCCCEDDASDDPIGVSVTIGLFAIVKVIRFVNLMVRSNGCCMPEECAETNISSENVCDVFDNMEFPMDIFCPPWGGRYQVESAMISDDDDNDCGCREVSDNSCSSCSAPARRRGSSRCGR